MASIQSRKDVPLLYGIVTEYPTYTDPLLPHTFENEKKMFVTCLGAMVSSFVSRFHKKVIGLSVQTNMLSTYELSLIFGKGQQIDNHLRGRKGTGSQIPLIGSTRW